LRRRIAGVFCVGGRVIEAHYLAGVAEAEERNGGFDPQTVASVPFESYLGFMYTVCVGTVVRAS
jgi:hypothetical protein